MPTAVALKQPKDFTLIGTPAKRTDTPSKVNGAATFAMDVRIPGMKFAVVAASPVLDGKLVSIDDTKAKAIAGVRQIVRLDDLVAVVADNTWLAKRGLTALTLGWDDGSNGQIDRANVVQELQAAGNKQGVAARNQGDAPAAIASAAKKIEAEYRPGESVGWNNRRVGAPDLWVTRCCESNGECASPGDVTREQVNACIADPVGSSCSPPSK